MKQIFQRKYIWLAAVSIMAAFILGWQYFYKMEKPEAEQQTVAVNTAVIKTILDDNTVSLIGTLEGMTSSIISSRSAGKIEQVLVEEGQMVSKGTALCVLDAVELNNSVRIAQNDVSQAELKYKNELTDYRRYENLFQKGAISEQQRETSHVRMLSSRMALDTARAALNNALKQTEEAVIVSPTDGVVANKNLNNGQIVAGGMQLMSIEQIEQVYVVVNVGQSELSRLKIGDNVELRTDGDAGQQFNGIVAVINPVAGKENRMFRVKIKVENSEQQLKPGMFIHAAIKIGEPQTVLAVPQGAVLSRKGVQYIYIAEDGRAKRVAVKTGSIIGDNIAVESGASAGMRVILDNLDNLHDGMPISIDGGLE